MASTHFTIASQKEGFRFTEREAGHLLRRAGFGASDKEIKEAVAKGLDQTVDDLFRESADEEADFGRFFAAASDGLMNFADPGVCQAWWMYRMMKTQTPLREKLTLFWHGHFASSYDKVNEIQLMLQQVETFRRHAWGSFRDLVNAVARDPAMCVYLDGQTNTKEHPNENFARELMELFTCGIGNYTEADVQAAAKAFSGWGREGKEFKFNAEQHDDGVKTFLGRRGRFDGGDIIDMVLALPATPKFMASKLLRYFAHPEPPTDVAAEAAEILDRSQLNIKVFLRELFLSDYFFSEPCRRSKIASPIEFLVGTVRTVGARLPASELVQYANSMGQRLLAPPSVKGWDGEEKWIHTSSLRSRQNFARQLAQYNNPNGLGSHLPLDHLVDKSVGDPEQAARSLWQSLFQGDSISDKVKEFAGFLVETTEGPRPMEFKTNEGFRDQKLRGLFAILLTLPEYQTC